MFKKNDFEPIMKRWKELADIIGKQIKIDVVGKTHIGEVMDVDNDGGVNTERRSGGQQRIFSGDVILARQVSARSLKKGGDRVKPATPNVPLSSFKCD